MKNLIFTIISLFCSIFFLHAQTTKTFKFKEKPNSLTITYHIINIVDEREDTTNIGFIRNMLNKKVIANLNNGARDAITSLVANTIDQNASGIPVEIHIVRFALSETEEGMKEKCELDMNLAFYVNGNKGIEYSGTPNITAMDATPYAEELMHKAINNSIQEFDKWIQKNDITPATLSSVKLEVVMATESDDNDRIVYKPYNLLQEQDFIGEPDDLSMAVGATYSGISMQYTSETKNGMVNVKVIISPVFMKSRSWLKKGKINKYTMPHEQLHFDITATEACKLLLTIKDHKFSADNYAKELEQLQKQYDKELQEMQKQYDKETIHGTIREQQLRWEQLIKQRIANLQCYK